MGLGYIWSFLPQTFSPKPEMTPTHSQAGLMIALTRIIVLFKLSHQYLRQEPGGPQELVSGRLLKPLHGGDR